MISQINFVLACFEVVEFKFVYIKSNRTVDYLVSYLSCVGELILNEHDILREVQKIVQVDVGDCLAWRI